MTILNYFFSHLSVISIQGSKVVVGSSQKSHHSHCICKQQPLGPAANPETREGSMSV
jgi:hypothetical protein